MTAKGIAAAALVALVLLAPACGGPAADNTLAVFAAASLTDSFEVLAAAFEAGHPGVTVTLNFAASSALREQILAGAPADVFASASADDMNRLAAAGALAGEPRVFARNRMVIAVPAGNPAGITGLEDFADPGRLIGLCAEEIPCGRYAREALASAGVTPSPDTLEPDVRALLTKVAAGELDAGIVYATDIAARRRGHRHPRGARRGGGLPHRRAGRLGPAGPRRRLRGLRPVSPGAGDPRRPRLRGAVRSGPIEARRVGRAPAACSSSPPWDWPCS